MYCSSCGQTISPQAISCPGCGQPNYAEVSPKSRLAVVLLAFFFGVLGIHRFYVGKIGTGILHLCTLGIFGIWTLIDFIIAICGGFTDKKGKKITRW
jgi:TM2 domain-containing membrane protein YozV